MTVLRQTALPWVEKYRPHSLTDVVSNENTIGTISRFVETGRIPHMLLHGPPGTGKTSTILAVAKQLYGGSTNECVLQLNASDDRGINVVRNQIKPFAQALSQTSKNLPKLIILDEADQMTQAAQNALRRVMEEFASNVRFCFICNYVSKIHEAIQSRCSRFKFHPLLNDQVVSTIQRICSREGIELTADGQRMLLKTGRGDMRRVLNTLQSANMANPNCPVDGKVIMATLGLPLPDDVQSLLAVLLDSDFQQGCEAVSSLIRTKGYALTNIANALQEICWTLDVPPSSLIQVMIRFGDLEKRLSSGTNEAVEVAALVGIFVEFNLENYNVYKS